MNIIRNAKNSANKRSIDNYGRIVETSMVEYQSQYLKYPDSIDQLEIEYVGSVIECETRRINPDKTIYLSECKVNGKKVLDKSTEDGYYHYGQLVLTNEEYVDKLGNNIELALKDYYKENNKYPVNYRLLNLPKLDKDVNCVSHINPDGTVYLTKCSIDGSYILNENEEDGYYHYGKKSIYDYVDNEGNGYNEALFLESAGEQYIDTGFKPNQDTKVEADYMILEKKIEFHFGARDSYNEKTYTLLQDDGYIRSDYNNQLGDRRLLNITDDNPYMRIKIVKDKNSTVINDSVISSASYNSFQSNYNMYIFSTNELGSPKNLSKIRLYSFKIYDNNNLVRDYIPVIDSNNRPCLYDKVGNKCYYNQGTGEFKTFYKDDNKICKDDNNNVFYLINYIESTGSQYINTAVNSTSNISLETSIKGDYANVAWYGGRIYSNYLGIYNYNGRFDYVGLDSQYINPSPDTWHDIIHGDSLTIDNNLVKTYNKKNYETSIPITLFAGNNNGNIVSFSSIKLRKAIIKNGDNVIRDFIPVLDRNGVACLFDKVAKKCYYNQGTGEFLYG